MSQNNVIFEGSSPSGAVLLDDQLTGFQENVNSNHIGKVRPSYIQIGGSWIDSSTEGKYIIKYFDGINDLIMGELNLTTLKFTPTDSYYKFATDSEFITGTATDKMTSVKQVIDGLFKKLDKPTVTGVEGQVLTVGADGLNEWGNVETPTGVVFTINEASKDSAGNANFTSINGSQIVFNGDVKYTGANGTLCNYNNISSIALSNGYIMLNNGVANVVSSLEINKNVPGSITVQQPVLSSNGDWGVDSFAVKASSIAYGAYFAWLAVNGTNTDSGDCWGSDDRPSSSSPEYYYFSFNSDVYLSSLRVTNRNRPAGDIGAISNFTLQYSADGVNNWTDIQSFSNSNGESNSEWSVNVTNKIPSSFFRLKITNVLDDASLCSIGLLKIVAYRNVVWFNPYNNQAKQWNGTAWVDYTGVPVGRVVSGMVYNYQYNTQNNITPWINIATAEDKEVITSWGIPDYFNGVSFNANTNYIAPSDGVVVGVTNSTTSDISINVTVNGVSVLLSNLSGGISMIRRTSESVIVGKGDIINISGSQISNSNKFYPFKGVI